MKLHTIKISADLYKELLFHSNEMESVDVNCDLNSITYDILVSVLCTLEFPNELADRFISLIDRAEARLDRQLDIHDRSKTVNVDNAVYSALNRIKGSETVSDMACTALRKGLAIMEMDLPELNELKSIYNEKVRLKLVQ